MSSAIDRRPVSAEPNAGSVPKVYDPKEVEGRLYEKWESEGYFGAQPDSSKRPFCIVIPPPNVTGILHIGHALDNTLQDVLIRFKRMQGFATLWVPGTDHAGIATQNVVERELREQGLTRHDLGREKFVERVWEWKKEYGTRIIQQLKRLGASCDWSRERFTMDPGLSTAVRKVFVDLYNEGLIYRGNRIINWCPRCETALSDIEVNHSDYEGRLDRFRYDFEDGSGGLSVATTRLETMLGDTAVAVHPDDERYREVIGKRLIHPFSGRLIPVVADRAVDPSFGTGAVKVTPAHDATDFDIAGRHDLPALNIFDGTAHVNSNGGQFAGMDRFEAREEVRKALEGKGLFEGSTPHRYAIGRCSRCNTIVEPWLSEQWFVKMRPLAAPAIAAVKDGRTRFYPERWAKYYLNWMEDIRDWCISRQLWWGHRIPVWYCDNGHRWAALEDPTRCAECGSEKIVQDPDVLDTWFSSQLWPFSTLGWPDQTPDLQYFYPTSVLVTGYEIIHLWVARMMMAGLKFMHEVPFGWVYVHGIVRDAQGRKMSKSIGNVIDPLELIDEYGTDALRFTLAEHATGQDIFLHTEWVAGSRNFANKLWNASRFVLTNAGDEKLAALPPRDRWKLADRWILSRLNATAREVTGRLESFEVAAAARSIYEFTWGQFCDWYIEAAKPRLYSDDPAARQDVLQVLMFVLDQALRLAHPIMPFVTEEIWQRLPIKGVAPSIMVAAWPESDPGYDDPAAEETFSRIQEVVSTIRSFRSEYRVDPRAEIRVRASTEDSSLARALEGERELITHLARLSDITVGKPVEDGSGARLVAGPVDVLIPLEGVVEVGEESARLQRALANARQEIDRLSRKLADEKFVSRAPEQVVTEQRRRLEEQQSLQAKLSSQLEVLRG
ncbi:MAG: valine--tRNA ligase [Actinomycetota bacterium]|nr:valine--tRNA ligase [Actinomycetota bacterium]